MYDRAGDDLRKRIQDLAYARFRHEKPVVQCSTDRLEFEVLQDEVYRGSFSISSVNGGSMKGSIYSSNPRMKCQNPEFTGTEADISFEFHSDGLVEGDIQKGDLTIIVNGGEYNLSFVASISRFYAVSSVGKMKNMFDFANLAQVSFGEAYRIFTAPFFENLFKETEEQAKLWYRGVGGRNASMQGLEEFLISIRKKHRIHITLPEQEKLIPRVEEDIKESVEIKKDQWGYVNLWISSDSDVIKPVKKRLTTEDFVGNRAKVEFVVCKERLHSGNNYARLTIRGLGERCECAVCIRSGPRKKEHPGREGKQSREHLTRLYLDYRMQKFVTGVWSKETCECLERLKELEPENLWVLLYQAQALFINKQRQEAEWLMDAFLRAEVDPDTPLYAYYLYLCTLQVGEPSYIAKVFLQIQEIYRKNQEDMRMFLIMLFLDPQLNQSRSRKLSAIQEKVAQGMYSPFLYMEAYYLICHDVYLLQRLGEFERRILYWAVREEALTQELAAQVIRLIPQLRKYHPIWYRILEVCCRIIPGGDSLHAICSFGIRWNLRGKRQLVWYEQGIREELRIAGLYEAWMECAGVRQLENFPRTAVLYFRYHSSLTDKKKAQLYAKIVQHKESHRSLYEAYQKQIQDFAIMQMQNGQINENLALLYDTEWTKLAINPQMAKALSRILYTHTFICQDDQAVRVVVIHRELNQEQTVLLSQGRAYIQIYTGSFCIFVEDETGTRYVPKESWELKRLMQPGRCIRQCIKEAPGELAHLLYYFDSRKTYHTFQEEDLPLLMELLEREEVSQEYRRDMKPQMIEYYYHSYTGEALDAYLKQVDCGGLFRGIRNKLVELMIARGVYDRAYEMLMDYGSEQASVSKLLIVAGHRIEETGYEEDEKLTGLCRDIFQRGKYNEPVLGYLCRYFQGNIRELERLWLSAREFEVDTYGLEERYLVQLLYSESYTESMEQIFQSYYDAMGQDLIIMAYLSYFSYQNFVREMPISDGFFQCLGHQLGLGNPLNDICRLAYFQWLAGQEHYSINQEKLLEEFLQENVKRRKYFAFYQKLPQRLLRKYHLHDRMILEYRSDCAKRVLIDYCYTGPSEELDYVEEEMEQVYEEIFVKQFVAFYGEEIPYYIKEESPNCQTITESGHMKPEDSSISGDESCYDLINGMMAGYHMKDFKTLTQLYGQYQKRRQETEALFRPL